MFFSYLVFSSSSYFFFSRFIIETTIIIFSLALAIRRKIANGRNQKKKVNKERIKHKTKKSDLEKRLLKAKYTDFLGKNV
jgi:hypothetical protein